MSKEDAACNRLAELALNDLAYASRMLKEAVSGCEWAEDSMQDRDVCRAFQNSLRQTLQVARHSRIRGREWWICFDSMEKLRPEGDAYFAETHAILRIEVQPEGSAIRTSCSLKLPDSPQARILQWQSVRPVGDFSAALHT